MSHRIGTGFIPSSRIFVASVVQVTGEFW